MIEGNKNKTKSAKKKPAINNYQMESIWNTDCDYEDAMWHFNIKISTYSIEYRNK